MSRALKLYRPSNGTEGDGFEGQFCDRCMKDREWREHERNPCEIHNAALAFDVDDEFYPREWHYGADGNPTCSAFVRDPSVPDPRPLTADEIASLDTEADRIAFEMIAFAHPVETHASDPDRFWELFRAKRPGVSRSEMERVLNEMAAAASTDRGEP